MSAALWVLQRVGSESFPYRLQLPRNDGAALLTLRVQDRWPAANRNIFCLRENEPPDEGQPVEEIERVPVLALKRRGLRLPVVLDRPRYKRCDFLFLKKPYKGKPSEEYEQIYWQTQRSMVQRRPRVSVVSQRGPPDTPSALPARRSTPGRSLAPLSSAPSYLPVTTPSLMVTGLWRWLSVRLSTICLPTSE